jgi:hypothetical protein
MSTEMFLLVIGLAFIVSAMIIMPKAASTYRNVTANGNGQNADGWYEARNDRYGI